MDFQTLNRRELQALCKLNKIPANITNIAMVDALKSLETVEGIEEFLNPSRSETAGLSTEAPEWIGLTSPTVPRTSCRTSTRQKVKKPEAESLHATVNRARRQLAGDANEFLKTPLVSSTRTKSLAPSSCQDLANQLNKCEDIAENKCLANQEMNCIPNTPMVTATVSRRKGTTTSTRQDTVKKETATIQTAYSTRRSTRLTAKKSAGPGVIETERSEPIKIDSFLDEVKDLGNPIEEKQDIVLHESDESSKIEKVVHVETTPESGESGEGVIIEAKSAENIIEVKSAENIENVDLEDLKADSESICNSSEDGDSEEKQMVIDEKVDLNEALNVLVKEQDAFLVPEEHTDNFLPESDAIDTNALPFNTENTTDPSLLKLQGTPCAVSETKNEISESNGAPYIAENLIHFNSESHNIDEEMTEESIKENVSGNKVDFEEAQECSMAVDVIMPAVIHGEVDKLNQEDNVDEVVDVSDNKENEENNTEKEGDGDEKANKSLHDTSLRQLKKQLKALSIKNNRNGSCVTTGEMEN